MKKTNSKKVEEFIRVDHAGERGAVKIYEGQLLALKTICKDNKLEKIIEEFGVVPENTNFGIKATVVRNLLEANSIRISKPNTTKLSVSELGQRIIQGTVHLSCLMTMAQIEQVRDQKVLFTEFD